MGKHTTDSYAVESEVTMITIEDLGALTLVNEENVASAAKTLDELERCFQQGSQGWGMRLSQSVILRLAQELRNALVIAETADKNHRTLKGLQLEIGRVKKALATASTSLSSERTLSKALAKDLQKARDVGAP